MNTLWLREDRSFMSVRPTDRWHAARCTASSSSNNNNNEGGGDVHTMRSRPSKQDHDGTSTGLPVWPSRAGDSSSGSGYPQSVWLGTGQR